MSQIFQFNYTQECTYDHYDVDTVCCSSLMHEEHICDRHLTYRLGKASSYAREDIGAPKISSRAHFRLPDSCSQTSSCTKEVATKRRY